jgi:hypothetical protein
LIEIEFEISYILYVNCRDQVLMTSSLSWPSEVKSQ